MLAPALETLSSRECLKATKPEQCQDEPKEPANREARFAGKTQGAARAHVDRIGAVEARAAAAVARASGFPAWAQAELPGPAAEFREEIQQGLFQA